MFKYVVSFFIVFEILLPKSILAYSANKVWFEFRPEFSSFRVYINYTVPELKEFREAYVDFKDKKKAEKFFFDLVKGADFHPSSYENYNFQSKPASSQPW